MHMDLSMAADKRADIRVAAAATSTRSLQQLARKVGCSSLTLLYMLKIYKHFTHKLTQPLSKSCAYFVYAGC